MHTPARQAISVDLAPLFLRAPGNQSIYARARDSTTIILGFVCGSKELKRPEGIKENKLYCKQVKIFCDPLMDGINRIST